jgi:hypothetical protein
MPRKQYFLAFALAAVTMQACSNPEPVWNEPISVVADPPTNTIRYVDSMYFPQGVVCGSAVTYWVYNCKPDFRLKEVAKEKDGHFVFAVTAVHVRLGLTVTTLYPFAIQDRLKRHEEAHLKMSYDLYKEAVQTGRDCANNLLGRKIIVEGWDLQTCKEKALLELGRTLDADYRVRMEEKADQQAAIFDRITNHGLNNVGEEEGIKQALTEYRAKPPVAKTADQSADSDGTDPDAKDPDEESSKHD